MSHSRACRRLGAGLSCLALCAGLSACGGGDDGASDKAYAKALDAFCRAVEVGGNTVQTDSAAAQSMATADPKKIYTKIGTALDTFADTVDRGVQTLRKVDVPGDYEDFNAQALSSSTKLVGKLREAADATTKGDAAALEAFSKSLDEVKFPALPKALQQQAPSCRRVSA